MSRLTEIFRKLQKECPVGEDGQPIGVTYEAISEALRIMKVEDAFILQGLRKIVIAEIAAGVSVYQGACGPEIHSATLHIAEGRQLVALLNGLLDAQEKLRKEKETLWKESEQSVPGSESQDSEESHPESLSPTTSSMTTES
jgi:hypothetical protein